MITIIRQIALLHLALCTNAALADLKIDQLPIPKKKPKLGSLRSNWLSFVSRSGKNLSSAPAEYRDDPEFVRIAVSNSPEALEFASPAMQSKRHIAMTAVSKNGLTLEFAKQFQGDKGVVLAAVKQNGMSLEFASKEMRKDNEVVTLAVNQDGEALLFSLLTEDPEVVLAAVKKNGLAVAYAASSLRNNPMIMGAAVSHEGTALFYGSEEIQANREVVLKAVHQNGSALQFASDELRRNKVIVLIATAQNQEAQALGKSGLGTDKKLKKNALQLRQFFKTQNKKRLSVIDFVKDSTLRNQFCPGCDW
eukprot:GSMAST32.ASY1.ANO1.1642.1 assembled CDS